MPCKPIALCSSLLLSQKKQKQKREIVLHEVVQPTPLRKGKPELGASNNPKLRSQARNPKNDHGDEEEENFELQKTKKKTKVMEEKAKPLRRSSSQAHKDFLRATAGGSEGKVVSLETLPSSEQAFSQFTTAYPRYSETKVLDQLRLQEYSHLDDEELVCLDYCGFGMFTNGQREDITEQEEEEDNGYTSSFTLTEIRANLWSNALFGCYPDGSMESGIRMRIMDFLNISETDYSMVFTASRGATFKLLADAYPWASSNRLVTMYDYESESVGWMEQRATERGAKVYRARFRWPSLRVCSSELKRELLIGSSKKLMKGKNQQGSTSTSGGSGGNSSRLAIASWLDRVSHQQQQDPKKQKKKGLFVFPVQSRVSGAKYSYQWMSLAQQNNWHVMLDASALGPKDMDSLGLSLFRPDFITASFYRLFGGDPSGFSCLFIKNSVIQSIQDPEGTVVSGMVRITPLYQQPSCSGSSISGESEGPELPRMISSFSGPVPAYDDMDAANSLDCLDDSGCEDNYSSACEDPEDPDNHSGAHSPVFSDDGNDNDYVDAGPSPGQSPSQEQNNGPVREDSEQQPQLASLVHQQSVKKDTQSSRSRIKGLCSGLLHLHTGRVGNSGEDVNSIKDGEKVYPEDNENGDLAIIKQLSAKKLGLLDSGKSVITSVSVSKSQQSKSVSAETGIIKEKVPEKLRLVLKKVKEEQHQADTVKESEKKLAIRKDAAEAVHQAEGLCPVGLETIQEIEVEAENPKLSEQDHVSAAINLQSLTKDSAICRESDGGFRLLGRRNNDKFSLNRIMSTIPGSESFHCSSIGGGSEFSFKTDEDQFEEQEEEEEEKVLEPHLLCRCLDHADMLGLNRTSFRLRYLINWLISSLLRLRHPGNDLSLVRIYGPQVRYDRGASVAFNIFDVNGRMLHPDLVRAMAEQFNIYLGLGFLRNIFFRGNAVEVPVPGLLDKKNSASQSRSGNSSSRVEVVTAALGLLSDFRDVYRLWAFVARFLDPHYVASELGHLQLTASNSISSSRPQSNADLCVELE